MRFSMKYIPRVLDVLGVLDNSMIMLHDYICADSQICSLVCKLDVSDVLKPDGLKPDVLKPDILKVYPSGIYHCLLLISFGKKAGLNLLPLRSAVYDHRLRSQKIIGLSQLLPK